MEAASVEQTRPAVKKRRKSAVGADPSTPWWMWFAVAAIVVFCLLPFYWLVNISLKTGSDLSSADVFPPSPSLENYKSIFENAGFTKALRLQRRQHLLDVREAVARVGREATADELGERPVDPPAQQRAERRAASG